MFVLGGLMSGTRVCIGWYHERGSCMYWVISNTSPTHDTTQTQSYLNFVFDVCMYCSVYNGAVKS